MYFKSAIILSLCLFAQNALANFSEFDLARCNELLLERNLKRGFLFSAVRLENSSLALKWDGLRKEAKPLFPNLRLKKSADLHITVVHIGEWNFESVQLYSDISVVRPTERAVLTPEIVQMGRKQQVIAIELHGIPESWTTKVIDAKKTMSANGLKKQESFDQTFRAHVTLAEARNREPTKEELLELAQFKSWLINQIDFSNLKLEVSIYTPVELLLAGASRSKDAPDYILLRDFIATLLQ